MYDMSALSTLPQIFAILNSTIDSTSIEVFNFVFSTCLCVAIVCWFVSVMSGNSSQVDRVWSIVPAVYTWMYTLSSPSEFVNARLLVMSLLSTMWSIRLTFNFWRKGGYRWEDEDYRWPQLRKAIPPFAYAIFNVVFIALYQNILLWLMSMPAYAAWTHQDVPLNNIDACATTLFIVCLFIETAADQQQWDFQSVKKALRSLREMSNGGQRSVGGLTLDQVERFTAGNADFERGFLTKGLFRYSRHPNFCAEISIWWCFYLFSVAASGQWINATVLGAVLLTMLFQGSTWYTEKLTLAKYPEYAEYQRCTSRLLPWFPAPSVRDNNNNKKRE